MDRTEFRMALGFLPAGLPRSDTHSLRAQLERAAARAHGKSYGSIHWQRLEDSLPVCAAQIPLPGLRALWVGVEQSWNLGAVVFCTCASHELGVDRLASGNTFHRSGCAGNYFGRLRL